MARKVYYTKNGQPYIKLASGRARFIKGRKKTTKTTTPKRKAKVAKTIYSRKSSNKSMARRTSIRRRSKAAFSGYSREIGTAIYAFAEPMADNLLNTVLPGVPADLVKLGAGFMFRKKKGIVGGAANAAMTIGIYKLVRGFLGGGGLGVSSGTGVPVLA